MAKSLKGIGTDDGLGPIAALTRANAAADMRAAMYLASVCIYAEVEPGVYEEIGLDDVGQLEKETLLLLEDGVTQAQAMIDPPADAMNDEEYLEFKALVKKNTLIEGTLETWRSIDTKTQYRFFATWANRLPKSVMSKSSKSSRSKSGRKNKRQKRGGRKK